MNLTEQGLGTEEHSLVSSNKLNTPHTTLWKDVNNQFLRTHLKIHFYYCCYIWICQEKLAWSDIAAYLIWGGDNPFSPNDHKRVRDQISRQFKADVEEDGEDPNKVYDLHPTTDLIILSLPSIL